MLQPERPALLRLCSGVVLTAVGLWALVLLPSQRWDWWAGWLYGGLNAAILGLSGLLLYRRRPCLLKRRLSIDPSTPNWDLCLLGGLGFSVLTTHTLAALDRGRGGLEPELFLIGLGVGCMLAGAGLVLWAMMCNPFFETTVSHQAQHHHRVVDDGPYRWVRHPGYTGGLLYLASTSLMLGSVYAALGWIGSAFCLMARCQLEERFLSRHLPGYEEYCHRVTSRLWPGIW